MILICTGCGAPVERFANRNNPRCFGCKKKDMSLRSLKCKK